MAFRSPPSTWCSFPPFYFSEQYGTPAYESGLAAYIDNATREMRAVDKRWRGAFNNRDVVSITTMGEKLVMVALDGTIWRKNPGKKRKMLSENWWYREYPAWSQAVEEFGRAHEMGECQVGILKSRMAEIPLWFPEGERFTDGWVQAFSSSVQSSLRQRASMALEEDLPDNVLDALHDVLEKFYD